MNLLKFRVKDFRAVIDSDWIDCQQITAFVGSNESGKTTLLLALMKLMDPHREFQTGSTLKSNVGKMARIILKDDVPIDREAELLPEINDRVFIEAIFSVDEELNKLLSVMCKKRYTAVETLYISKTYGGMYNLDLLDQFDEDDWENVITLVLSRLPVFLYFQEVTEVKSDINLVALAYKLAGYKKSQNLTQRESIYANLLNYLDIWQSNLIKSLQQAYGDFSQLPEKDVDFDIIFNNVPLFRDRFTRGFQSLNEEFRKWWGNNDLTIAYEVYKKGVQIKIVDASGKQYLLENRSTGFRRFFALFLSFSVSAKQDFENAILLFDEAGAALHPLTQRKLANFFMELGKFTQIMYNTHTSYMLPVSEMNRARVVYKDSTGHTKLSPILRINSDRSNEESLFAVQASLAMHLAESALAGCLPIVVMDEQDMSYLQIIKNVLCAKGRLNTVYETLIFSTGANGIDAATEIFSADESLPVVLLASDENSRRIKERLLRGTYKHEKHKVFSISDFMDEAVYVEDIMPSNFVEIFSRVYLRETLGEGFEYSHKVPLISQIEEYAKKNSIKLPVNYRAEMARRMKINTMKFYNDVNIPLRYTQVWMKMLHSLLTV
ncbi:MAG: ATP-binding protein [Clostridiales bacterium]|jgi:energy-coupling factor transporter ATP-binding protein EcfA2|nr:ATP-binding protein [Clostridiales bacterium]